MTPELAEATAVDTPVTTQEQSEQPVQAPVLPVMAHAEKYSEAGRQKEREARASETPEQKTAREEKATQQKRDKETGQFQPGKARHKAESQKASPDDVPRIHQLTARAKGAEERLAAAEAELARLRAERAPQAQIARAEANVEAKQEQANASTFTEPEPDENDPKFAGDYSKYLRAVSGWEGRKAYHDARETERQQQAQEVKAQQAREALKTFADRNDAARQRYPDFDAVAFEAPAPWLKPDGTAVPQGHTLDAWIMEHEAGPDVLYYFQSEKNRQELDSLLAKPVIKQVEHLALLSQRLLPTSSTPAGVTRAVAATKQSIVLPPKPPTLVRTEAQRTTGGPPPTDGSLSVLDHAKRFRRS